MKKIAKLCLTVCLLWQINGFCSKHSEDLEFQPKIEAPVCSSLEKHKKSFQENGFVWIKNFFSPAQVSLLKAYAKDAHRSANNILKLAKESGSSYQNIVSSIPGTLVIVPEANNPLQVCRTEDMLTVYPNLMHLIEGTVTAYLSQLLDEPYVLFKDKLNYKWPGGGAFPPHQDQPAFASFGPAEFITAMVCIDPADYENGCLQVAKKWKQTFADHSELNQERLAKGNELLPYIIGGPKHGSIQPQYVEKIEWLPLNVSPGDLVIFDAYLPHYSEPNQSNSSRRAMFFTLNKLCDGEYRKTYYHTKRNDPNNPLFHFATPTNARGK